MTIHEASRTLLKSPPELWAECSDATSLSRHLDSFGEIRITRLEPETAVAWEGEQVSGTVKLEPSGWGTRVILTAEEVDPVLVAGPENERAAPEEPEPAAEQPEPIAAEEREPVAAEERESVAAEAPELAAAEEPAPAAEAPATVPDPPQAQPQPEPEPKIGFFARLFGRKRQLAWPQVEPVAAAQAEAQGAAPDPVVAQEPVVEPEPDSEPEPLVTEVAPEPEANPAPAVQASEPEPTLHALTTALESLGMAHHRPFSRS